MNWTGEDWLIVGIVGLWLALIALWVWRWLEADPLTPPRRARDLTPDEHEDFTRRAG